MCIRDSPRRVRFFNISKIIIPRQSYNEAIAWYEKGHYDTAKSIFKQLGEMCIRDRLHVMPLSLE